MNLSPALFILSGSLLSTDLITRAFLMVPELPSAGPPLHFGLGSLLSSAGTTLKARAFPGPVLEHPKDVFSGGV